ncbi:efflux RND transporter periplasmic adaptor subunit [Candidatus Binatus soli]|uniref:efflux RND transporter periplasmic adaptor subunit n=1 Tax=Candidatus Binatus soli TaxID=1953413 RepID=UPI003D151A71
MRLGTSLALLIGGAMVGAVGCGNHSNPEQPRIAVTVLTVRAAQESNSGAYTASFQPDRQVPVKFQVSGYIDSIAQLSGADGRARDLQGGDTVKEHELLATVKPEIYQAQVNQAASALTGAQAANDKAKRDFDRDTQLLDEHILAPATYDAARQQYQSAQSEVAQSQAALKQAQINLGYCKLYSPMDGVILGRSIEVGSLAEPDTVAFQVADTSEMKAVFGVSDIQVAKLKEGQSQTLAAEAIPGVQLNGKITRIAPNADPTTRVFDVEITVPNQDARIRTGSVASLSIIGASAPVVTDARLPLNAIVRPPDDRHDFAVYVVEEQGARTLAHLRKVHLGEIVGNDITVSSGVQIGDRVIIRGATMVTDGAEVRIIP